MAGIENVFAQEFDLESEKWYIWFWETDSVNTWKWKESEYEVYVFQTINDGTGFMYSENIQINVFTGASHHTGASYMIAAASVAVLLALI